MRNEHTLEWYPWQLLDGGGYQDLPKSSKNIPVPIAHADAGKPSADPAFLAELPQQQPPAASPDALSAPLPAQDPGYDAWLGGKADAGAAGLAAEAAPQAHDPERTPDMQASAKAIDDAKATPDTAHTIGRWLDSFGSAFTGTPFDVDKWDPNGRAAHEAADRDPNSPHSRALQASIGERMRAAGQDPSTLQGLNANDLQRPSYEQWLAPKKPTDPIEEDYRRAMAEDLRARAGERGKPKAVSDEEAALMAARTDEARALAEEQRARAGKLKGHSGGGGPAAFVPPSGASDRLKQAWGEAEIPADVQARWDSIEHEPARARSRAEAEFFGAIANDQRRNAKGSRPAPGGRGDALTVDDIQGTGWVVDDPSSAERIINKRALTKDTLHQLADAHTAFEAFDKVIANREKHGSNASKLNQTLATDNALQIETAKQNYANAMNMPNTDATQHVLAQLFPDPNAIGGQGIGGMIEGVGAQLGIANDPVLAELKAARAEALHNLQAKIPIPSLRYVGKGARQASAASSGRPAGAVRAKYSKSTNTTYWLDAGGAVIGTSPGAP